VHAAKIRFIGLAALLLLTFAPVCAFAEIEWSVNVTPQDAAPKSFPTAAIHLRNAGRQDAAITVKTEAEAPLRSISSKETTLTLAPGEETTALHTLYVPPGAAGGTSRGVRVTVNGESKAASLRIKESAAFKARALSTEALFLQPGKKATYKIRLENFGNVPQDFAVRATTSPLTSRTRAFPEHVQLAPGMAAEASIEVETDAEVAESTTFVTIVEVQAPAATDGHTSEFLYFHTEVFPKEAPVVRSRLFETLKGSVRFGVGAGHGNDGDNGNGDALFRAQLTLEGMITEQTRLEFEASGTHPTEGKNGASSGAVSSLPGSSLRNFFHLALLNPRFDIEAGEISVAPARLLSSRETGDGLRVAYRPRPGLQIEAFGERNTLTLTDKTVFGASISGVAKTGALEFWKLGTLSKRDDVGPQGKNWDAAALETGWKLPGTFPLRAELSAGLGRNDEGGSGSAWLAGLHYNRTLPGEKDTSPLKAGVEFATGEKGFPGVQNGREDRRAYVTLRLSEKPFFSEAYINFSDSEYKVVPRVEKTLAEELDALPDFLHTSQSRLLTTGVRWKKLPESKSWLPSGGLEYQETSFFNKDNFFDRSEERAVALTLQPFDALRKHEALRQWDFNLLTRVGTEEHQQGTDGPTKSRFITLGADTNWTQPTPRWLDRIDGAGTWSFNLSGRYTVNFENDPDAFNRTGLSATTSTVWQTRNWNARAAASVYKYEGDGLSLRTTASITRRVAKGWWAGIEAAFVHRGASSSRSESPDESAVFLTFRHDFDVAVPWLPRRGQSTGVVFNDLNNNGVRDLDEPGLAGVKIGVGTKKTLTGPDGHFTLPTMDGGTYPVAITPPPDAPLNQREAGAVNEITLTRGQVTPLSIAMTKPTACEGHVRVARENIAGLEIVTGINAPEEIVDLSGIEIVATDEDGVPHRSFTRADGFFALYLEPGVYSVKIAAGLKSRQTVAPEKMSIDVKRDRLENLDFTLTEKVRQIRKTFTAKTAQHP
jgi:hypothetical protein